MRHVLTLIDVPLGWQATPCGPLLLHVSDVKTHMHLLQVDRLDSEYVLKTY